MRFHLRSMALFGALAALTVVHSACWELADDTSVEGNYDITYDDLLRVYLNDELVVEIDRAEGGEIPLGEDLVIQYDELCSDEAAICPSESLWNEVALTQPMGTDRALLNAVNLGDVGEEGARLAGLMDDDKSFVLLLGLSAAASDHCLAVGVSTADAVFEKSRPLDRQGGYDRIEDGVIAVAYAAGCEIADGVIVSSALRFETGFTGVRTGDVDTGDVDADPAIDENGEPVEDPIED